MLRYYYSTDEKDVKGPVAEKELRELLGSGALPESTRVCILGSNDWKPAAHAFRGEPSGDDTVSQPLEAHPFVRLFAPIGRTKLRIAALVIAIVGFGSAALIYSQTQSAPPPANQSASSLQGPMSSQDDKKFLRNVEMNGGKLGVLAYQWSQALTHWTDPAPLAALITLLTCTLTGSALAIASRLPRGR